jgi:hypothetical protein
MGVVPHLQSTMHFQPGSDRQSLLDEHPGRSHSTTTLAQKPVRSVVSAQKQLGLSWQVTRVGIPPGQIEAQLQSPSVSGVPGQPHTPPRIPPHHRSGCRSGDSDSRFSLGLRTYLRSDSCLPGSRKPYHLPA